MDERRRFFRVKNNGEIHAKIHDAALEIIDISSSGALIKKNNLHMELSQQGIMELNIHNFSMSIHYKVLKIREDTMVMIFEHEDEISTLFPALKNLRNKQEKQ